MILVLGVGFQLKADQLDAYPQGSQPPPETQPPPQQYQAPPEYQPASPPYEPPPRRRGWRVWRRDYPDDSWTQFRILIKAYFNTAGAGYSNNSTITNNFSTNSGNTTVNLNTAPGFGAEVFMAPPFGVGFDGGAEYELSRTINNLNNPNALIVYTASQPSLQFIDIYANAVFRWLNFYLPLGLNYCIPSFSAGTGNGLIGNTTVQGNVGFQVGLGYLIGEHFSFLLEDRIIQFTATSTSASGNTSLNWGNVSLPGLQFDLKFAF